MKKQVKIPVKRDPIPSARQRDDASRMVDVLILTQIIQTSLYGLQIEYEKTDEFRQITKSVVNGAINFIIPLSGAAYRVFGLTSQKLANSYMQTYDDIQKNIDETIYLQGVEKELSIIVAACEICEELMNEVTDMSKSVFPKVPRVKTILTPVLKRVSVPNIKSIIQLILSRRLMEVE